MQKLKVNDEAVVIAGKNKGRTGKVMKVDLKNKRVLVSGVNMLKKAQKPTQENPTGGITEIEAPLHISNVSVVSPKTNKATRVRIETKDGKRVRVAVACGSVLN
jgi:large subunit ribosomal protein L24